jgi:hypothetical protein
MDRCGQLVRSAYTSISNTPLNPYEQVPNALAGELPKDSRLIPRDASQDDVERLWLQWTRQLSCQRQP